MRNNLLVPWNKIKHLAKQAINNPDGSYEVLQNYFFISHFS